mmetsp:Transcript_37648/g.38096  ORF Transcript_37648/g.38096 Transcript_37648/m.38096 type:complete len:142 (+) Transcript_37648:226-651(+)
MTSLTNYDSITSKDGPFDYTNQDKKEATPFLRSILRHKFLVTLVVVVVSSVVFMTYSAIHQEVATTTPTTSLLRLDGVSSGITGSGGGALIGGGQTADTFILTDSGDGSGGGQRVDGTGFPTLKDKKSAKSAKSAKAAKVH